MRAKDFKIGDIVEIFGDNAYWDGARGPVVSIDGGYVTANFVTASTSRGYQDRDTSGTVRNGAGFSPEKLRLVAIEPDETEAFFV